MLTDGRLAGVELLSCLGEAFVFIDGYKYFQVSSFYFDSPVLIYFHVE